jgi:hypothetical protein
MGAESAGVRGIAGLTAEEVVRLADWLKPAGRSVDTLSTLLNEVDCADRDRIVLSLRPGDSQRLRRLSAFTFAPDEVRLARLRPWPGMGGLPCQWTDVGNVVDVAARVNVYGVPAAATRLEQMWTWARHHRAQALSWLRRLPLIAIPEFHARAWISTSPLTLDDGSHRAVVLALLGEVSAPCWVGASTIRRVDHPS